jgi:hypothetical protein
MGNELPIIYDDLYQRASAVIARINPCEIVIVNGKATCVDSRTTGYRNNGELCCGGCRHLSKQGCTVKALACKLWLCITVKRTEKGKQAMQELRKLELEAYRSNVPMPYRNPMEAHATHL